MRPRRFTYERRGSERLTHYLFRYPAKFHPPVARALIEQFSNPGDLVLDPFCGSGTLLVEALPIGRNMIGVDIDPVATFVSRVKTMRISPVQLRGSAKKVLAAIAPHERPAEEYHSLMFADIDDLNLLDEVKANNVAIPNIPNFSHWFRNHVALDLAMIKREIDTLDIPERHRAFFRLCFGSIIRNSSNADPVPISGLEVTSYMLKKEKKGRQINPFKLFRMRLRKSLDDWEEFQDRMNGVHSSVQIRDGDAARVRSYVRKSVDVVITSPPYHNAVDYYRRHTLEMYWLNLVETQHDRLAIRSKYIGRHRVARSDPFVAGTNLRSNLAKKWEARMADHCTQRAADFKHYVSAMTKSAAGLSALLEKREQGGLRCW